MTWQTSPHGAAREAMLGALAAERAHVLATVDGLEEMELHLAVAPSG